MLTMGSDFNYQNANTWYKNMDKLIHYVNLMVSKLILPPFVFYVTFEGCACNVPDSRNYVKIQNARFSRSH